MNRCLRRGRSSSAVFVVQPISRRIIVSLTSALKSDHWTIQGWSVSDARGLSSNSRYQGSISAQLKRSNASLVWGSDVNIQETFLFKKDGKGYERFPLSHFARTSGGAARRARTLVRPAATRLLPA